HGLVLDFARIAVALGFKPYLMPFRPNGKPLHVLGRLKAFERQARATAEVLQDLAGKGFTLVGIEPATTLAYHDEYREIVTGGLPVLLPQQWLASKADRLSALAVNTTNGPLTLMLHCTERTLHGDSKAEWTAVISALGRDVSVPNAGCCG